MEVISGFKEALLSSKGAALGLGELGDLITIDIGGQSSEVCWRGVSGAVKASSLPLGVVGLKRRYLGSDPPTTDEIEKMTRDARDIISNSLEPHIDGKVVCVAGTATTLGWLELGLDTWRREKVHGLEVSVKNLEIWLDRMVAISSKERQKRWGIREIRADVFPAGLVVLREFLLYLGRDSFIISANGLRVGVALELLNPDQ